MKDEEKQRVFGVIPNFYVTYDPHPLPLTSKEKYELAWKTTADPVTLAIIGGIAGVQQAQNTFSGYGQGAQVMRSAMALPSPTLRLAPSSVAPYCHRF